MHRSKPIHITARYQFGFNGQLKDNEICGEGNAYTAEFWEYDPRSVRRWNVDPKPNISLSPYNCFAGNPILFSDVAGDTVRYSTFKERFDVFVSKLFSKEFRKEFKELKNSKNVYEYKRFEGEVAPGSGGRIVLINEHMDENLVVPYRSFQIQYTKTNLLQNLEGKSRYHALFEETFHAVDYELGRSSSAITKFDKEGVRLLGHRADDETHEARAWAFAANNAPFKQRKPYAEDKWGRFIVINSLVQQIRNLKNDPHAISKIADLLYRGYEYQSEDYGTGEIQNHKHGPLYSK